ncbi:uncharacterized protein LOC141627852 [Silene latifolia]|uniref:uncharacterized protein LOC141627852 n=1 Tax=Silene latifolia TaxID=37657 RepID=UPI003D76A5B7
MLCSQCWEKDNFTANIFRRPSGYEKTVSQFNGPCAEEQLVPGEESHNRPDIIARVFRAKLLALKKQIVDKHIFGEVAAYVYVVEFQKRGLPHVHFLIIFKDGHNLKCAADYDKFVSAEIPTAANPSLRAIVLKHMMHGPCGKLNPECSCMKHVKTPGQCNYEYPKDFTANTTTNIVGHLNVEVCATMHAVKYLYKYIYKGHDRISFSVMPGDEPQVVDKIVKFQSRRWVSSCEAAWRIFGFDLFETHPAVRPLQVHLPNMQIICLRPSENLTTVLADDKRSRTPLSEFFRTSSKQDCPKFLYGEFTEHFRWDTGTKTWEKRKKKVVVIGRLVFVAPAEGERYFLRLLLLHIRGPTSFEELQTVNGYRCATFQEVVISHRLLEHEDAAELCMVEACTVQMPLALWRLFSTLLIFAQPKDPTLLWNTHYNALPDDFRHKFSG